jgi:hypothetical protein
MSYQEHLKSCGYCQNIRATKLAELGRMVRGTSISAGTKGASVVEDNKKPGHIEKAFKLKELGKLVRGYS